MMGEVLRTPEGEGHGGQADDPYSGHAGQAASTLVKEGKINRNTAVKVFAGRL